MGELIFPFHAFRVSVFVFESVRNNSRDFTDLGTQRLTNRNSGQNK
jgi:hypothetical protein